MKIAEWTILPNENALESPDRIVRVAPRSMELLVYLATHSDRVVSKEELLENLWPDTFVGDSVVWVAISDLRRALGDDPKNPKFIETMPKRGYRLMLPASAPGAGRLRKPLGPSRSRLVFIPLLVILMAGGLFSVWDFVWNHPRVEATENRAGDSGVVLRPDIFKPSQAKPKSVAVLPFRSSSSLDEEGYLSEAISTGLSTVLSQSRDLKVIPSSALHRFYGVQVDPMEVGAGLHVDAAVYGLLWEEDKGYTLSLELLDTRNRNLLWAKQYQGDLRELISKQEGMARSILSETAGQPAQQILSWLAHQLPRNTEAQVAYLRGRYFYDHRLLKDPELSIPQAMEALEKAIALEPDFAPAYHWLSKTYYHRARIFQAPENLSRARVLAEKALELGDSLGEIHQWMGDLLWSLDGDWQGAQEQFELARQRNPLLGPSIWYLLVTGQRKEAVDQIELEYSMADPWSVTDAAGHGWYFFYAREYDRAIELEKQALKLDPDHALAWLLLSLCYEELGRDEQAVEARIRALQATRNPSYWGLHLNESEASMLFEAFQTGGMEAYWNTLLDRELPLGYAIGLSTLYARLGNKEKTLEWLIKAGEMDKAFVTAPMFDLLREDPVYHRRLADHRLVPPSEFLAGKPMARNEPVQH